VADEDAADFAEIADGVTSLLAACPSGSAQVLWREGGTGAQWAVVKLGNDTRLPVFTTLEAAQAAMPEDTLAIWAP
jgi:hypothetical protein